nr:hypothetical protein [Tanacetum cinerariifolium]
SVWRDLFAKDGFGDASVAADELSFFVGLALNFWSGVCIRSVSKDNEVVTNYANEHQDFALRLNTLVGQMNEACSDRIAFVQELRSAAGDTMPAKTVLFLERMMDKEGNKECQLRDLEKEARDGF